jgi:hypothetical protein
MKKLLLLAVLVTVFMSCEKDDDITPTQQPESTTEVVETWQMYRDENLESVIDQWTGTEWTYVDQWFSTLRDDSDIILEFKVDGTFLDRYADVVAANGTWGKLADGRYYMDYSTEDIQTNDQLAGRRFITLHCDNTYSLEIEDNDRAIYYYKIMDQTECGELITYNVD